jgi:hypothetical protein
MKTTSLLFLLAVAFLLSSCTSNSPQSRIESNPQLFNKLSAKDRELVTQGMIREGMTKDGVFLAWGAPDQTAAGRKNGREIEEWTYVGQRPVRTMSMNMGFGYGWGGGPWGWGGGPWGWGPGWGPGWGTDVIYVPYTAGVVGFRSGLVTEWKAARR